MSYCTVADVQKVNSSLLGAVADATIQEYIDFAEHLVDGVLNQQYSVPFSSVDALVKGITIDLAASKALEESVGNSGTDEAPSQAERLWDRSMDLLEKIGKGEITLTADTVGGDTPTGKPTARSSTYSTVSVFGSWDPSNHSTMI